MKKILPFIFLLLIGCTGLNVQTVGSSFSQTTQGRESIERQRSIPSVPPFVVTAKINGAGPLRLLVDTGADHAIISPEAMRRIGFEVPNIKGSAITGMTGRGEAITAWVESIEVEGFKAGPFVIAIHPVPLSEVDGLLGRDFLIGFKGMKLEREKGTVTFLK